MTFSMSFFHTTTSIPNLLSFLQPHSLSDTRLTPRFLSFVCAVTYRSRDSSSNGRSTKQPVGRLRSGLFFFIPVRHKLITSVQPTIQSRALVEGKTEKSNIAKAKDNPASRANPARVCQSHKHAVSKGGEATRSWRTAAVQLESQEYSKWLLDNWTEGLLSE